MEGGKMQTARCDKLLTRDEAAAYLGVSKITLDRITKERGFPALVRIGIGRGRVYINRERLDEWIESKTGQ